MGRETQTAYIIQKDWRWSPEVWGTMFWVFVAGVIAGLILFAVVSSDGHKTAPSPAATVTVTETASP